MSFKKDVVRELSEIKSQLAVNNQILSEHHRRSTNLEERVKPLEHSHLFFNKLSKSIAAFIALLAACSTCYHYLIK